MKPRSLSPRSIAATTMLTSGWASWTRSMPSGAAMIAISRMDVGARAS